MHPLQANTPQQRKRTSSDPHQTLTFSTPQGPAPKRPNQCPPSIDSCVFTWTSMPPKRKRQETNCFKHPLFSTQFLGRFFFFGGGDALRQASYLSHTSPTCQKPYDPLPSSKGFHCRQETPAWNRSAKGKILFVGPTWKKKPNVCKTRSW